MRDSCLPRWTVCPAHSPSLGTNCSMCCGERSLLSPLATPPGRCHHGPLANGAGRIPPYCVSSGGADTVTGGGGAKPLRPGPLPHLPWAFCAPTSPPHPPLRRFLSPAPCRLVPPGSRRLACAGVGVVSCSFFSPPFLRCLLSLLAVPLPPPRHLPSVLSALPLTGTMHHRFGFGLWACKLQTVCTTAGMVSASGFPPRPALSNLSLPPTCPSARGVPLGVCSSALSPAHSACGGLAWRVAVGCGVAWCWHWALGVRGTVLLVPAPPSHLVLAARVMERLPCASFSPVPSLRALGGGGGIRLLFSADTFVPTAVGSLVASTLRAHCKARQGTHPALCQDRWWGPRPPHLGASPPCRPVCCAHGAKQLGAGFTVCVWAWGTPGTVFFFCLACAPLSVFPVSRS